MCKDNKWKEDHKWKPTGCVYHSNPAQYEMKCETCHGKTTFSTKEYNEWCDARNPDKIKIKELEHRIERLEAIINKK